MHIAVTGARGRVGSAVVAMALEHGHTVVAIDRAGADDAARRDNVDPVSIDVTDYDNLQAAITGCDALVHLAAITGPGVCADHVVHNTNVVGSYNALLVAAQVGITRVCLASSVNAIGGVFSRSPRYDYFPVDERHPTYAEDPYSLSKWIAEQQASAFARRYPSMTIASLRLHGIVPSREAAISGMQPEPARKYLWGYTTLGAAARACLLSLGATFTGHEVFQIVAPRTASDVESGQLCRTYYPDVPIVQALDGYAGFFDCDKAEHVLGWRHDGGSA